MIENKRETIADLSRRHGGRRLVAFGSVLRQDFNLVRRDVDVLVEFAPGVASSFANFQDLKETLQGHFVRGRWTWLNCTQSATVAVTDGHERLQSVR